MDLRRLMMMGGHAERILKEFFELSGIRPAS